MKKFITLLSALTLATSASYALNFFAGQHASSDRNLKWSTCTWGDNVNFDTKPLPSKPGPNDTASNRYGNFVLDIDMDINVGGLGASDGAELTATGRKIKVKRDFGVSICTGNGRESLAKFTKSAIDIGGNVRFSFWHEAKGAGTARISLIDTKMNVKGGLSSSIPVNPLVKNEERAGIVISVEGDSVLSFGGGAVLDSLHQDDPSQWMMKFAFTETNGKVPKITFDKKAEMPKCDLEINVSKNVKKGSYALMEFYDRKSGVENPNKITVNGKAYTLGEEIKIGDRTAKISFAPAPGSKDTKTPNDLVLDVQ